MSFKKFVKELKEETTSADITTVDNKLDFSRRDKHRSKGKKCKSHKRLECRECKDSVNESWS